MIFRSVDEKRAFVQGKGVAGIDVAQQWHYVRWIDPAGPRSDHRDGSDRPLLAPPGPLVSGAARGDCRTREPGPRQTRQGAGR